MKRKLLALSVAALLVAVPAFSQDIGTIQDGAKDLVDTLATSLPFNSTVGLNWSDAYIGQIVAVPPHFGAGVTIGTTTMDGGDVSDLMDELGYNLPSGLETSLPLPAATAEARIGGFILPFDFGIKVGYLPEGSIDMDELEMNYLLVGADIRYALIKGNIALPTISVGLGVNYMKGGMQTSVGDDMEYEYTAGTENYRINATEPDIGIEWQTTVIDLKAQISKSFIIFTPYFGLGASYATTKAGYYIDSDVKYYKNNVEMADTDDLEDALKDGGYSIPDLNDSGIAYDKTLSTFGVRAFGGLSVNMLIVKLDLTGMYNFADSRLGGSVGLRIQF